MPKDFFFGGGWLVGVWNLFFLVGGGWLRCLFGRKVSNSILAMIFEEGYGFGAYLLIQTGSFLSFLGMIGAFKASVNLPKLLDVLFLKRP